MGTVELKSPMMISARLMAAVEIGHATISIEPTEHLDNYGKQEWLWYIDGPDIEAAGGELHTHQGHRATMGSLLSFLGAAAESYEYEMRGNTSDNRDLFEENVSEWCYQNADELAMLQDQLENEETEG